MDRAVTENLLSQKINLAQIKKLVSQASGNNANLDMLWDFVRSSDRRTSVNALWVLLHLPADNYPWLHTMRNSMIDMLLEESDTAKKRILLSILRDMDCQSEPLRTDFLDYCLSKINSEHEPYAIRCFSLYNAFNMCRKYPELLAELEHHLNMLEFQSLSPGLKSALRQTKTKISKLPRQ
ncbi:MAG: hypothetical protein K2I69_06165 [Muribaculaceae bacterium]|nr:hypothetical protein [Muribaculaceae bacterium]